MIVFANHIGWQGSFRPWKRCTSMCHIRRMIPICSDSDRKTRLPPLLWNLPESNSRGVYGSHTGCPCRSVEWCLRWILTLSESLPFDVECADWITGGAEKYMNLLGISNELCIILRKHPIRFPSEQTHQRLGKSGTQHSTVDGSWKFS